MKHPTNFYAQAERVASTVAALRHSKSPGFYRLRRGSSILDAQLEPEFHKLKAQMPYCPDGLLAVALLLAARADGSQPLMEALSKDNARTRAGAHDSRVARFIRSSDPLEVFTQVQRFIAQCKGQVSPYDVAAITLRWQPLHVDALRKDLLAAYFHDTQSA